jgi:hypothetical protein
LRAVSILGYCLVLALFLTGCASEKSDGSASEMPIADAPASQAPTNSAGENELTRRWGPVTMPDQDTEPLEFLYWRVDSLYDVKDADQDGRLTMDEFGGQKANFERIDVDADGFVVKKEIIDDMTQVLREQGSIP